MTAAAWRIDALYGKPGHGYVIDSQKNGIALVPACGPGDDFKVELLWPNVDFASAPRLYGEARADMMRRIVKSVLMKRTEAGFVRAFAEILKFFIALESVVECEWVQLRLFECGIRCLTPGGENCMEKAVSDLLFWKIYPAAVQISDLRYRWYEILNANLLAGGEEARLYRRMTENDMKKKPNPLYAWSREDVEECAAFYRGNHWLSPVCESFFGRLIPDRNTV